MKNKLTSKISIVAATVLTLGTCLPAGIAFADPDPETPPTPPSVGNQSGAGSTALTMVWENANAEYGGTEYQSGDYANPDGSDADEWGDNLAFSAPSAINFVAQANGNLLAPQSNIDIVNHSTYGIRVSSMKLDANTTDGWNIVSNAEAAANTPNAVWGEIGVENDMLNWASYTSAKANVTKAYEWNMNANGNTGSSLSLATSGSFANLSIDLSTAQTFGTIHWYLKAGNADGPVSITSNAASVENGSFVIGTSNDATENELLFAGDTAHVVTTPATGYKLASVTVIENGTSNVIQATVEGNNATFTMPASAVTVSVMFESSGPTLPAVSSLSKTSSYTYIDNNSSNARSKIITIGTGGDLSLSDLKEVSNDIATKGYDGTGNDATRSKYSTTIASYMANDVSFVFADDPNAVKMEYRIIGVNHAPSDGETGLTFMAKKALDQGFNFHNSSRKTGGWASSVLRSELNPASVDTSTTASADHIYQLLPPSLRSAEANGGVKTVTKHSNDNSNGSPAGNAANHTSSDRFWLISYQELYGDTWFDITGNVNTQYEYFVLKGVTFAADPSVSDGNCGLLTNMNTTITDGTITKTPSNIVSFNSSYWWLRSAFYHLDDHSGAVSANGRPGAEIPTTSIGVLPCFCL